MHKLISSFIVYTLSLIALNAATVDFSDLSPSTYTSTGQGYYNSITASGTFTSGGRATFNQYYNTTYSSWAGWSYSSATNSTTGGYSNQYTAMPGNGVGGSSVYAIGYQDTYNAVDPTITFAGGYRPLSLEVTNTAYAYYSMLNGDQFAKKFGGSTGDDADWFLLTITGYNSSHNSTGVIYVYLADYRSSDNAQDYILSGWETVDLTSLGADTTSLDFSLSSSDNSYGYMNTPSYFALGSVTTTPEPSSAVLLMVGAAAWSVLCRRARTSV